MNAFDLFSIAVWVWFCLVFLSERPLQAFFFFIPLLVIGFIGTLLEWVFKAGLKAMHATGEW